MMHPFERFPSKDNEDILVLTESESPNNFNMPLNS